MSLKSILFVLSTSTSLLFANSLIITPHKNSYCTGKCKGPYQLQPNIIHKPKIVHREYKCSVLRYESIVEVIYASRRYWTNYCYDGGFIDPNTGCNQQFHDVSPTKQDSLEWATKGLCPVGIECVPDGTCWGSDSAICHSKEANQWVKGKEIQNVGSRYMFFPHHTCVSSWECSIKILKLPTHLCGFTQSSEVCTYYNNGTLLPLQILRDGFKINEFTTLSLFREETQEPQYTLNKLSCYQTQDSFSCLLPILGDNIPITIDPKTKKGFYKNYMIEVMENLSFLDQTIDAVKQGEPNSGSPASIDDVVLIMSALKVDNLINNLNIASIVDVINQLREVTNSMVKSISKIDDFLIGNIINKSVTTIWSTKSTFNLCECINSFPEDTNCYQGNKYSKGRYTSVNKIEDCTLINEEPQQIDLFAKTNITFEEATISNFDTASLGWDGWSWIVNKEMKRENDPSNHNLGSPNTSFGIVTSMPIGFGILKDYFVVITCISFWVFMIIIRR